MELALAAVLCLSILNVLPWVFLMIRRPDNEISNQLVESDAALAQLIQIIMAKMESLEETAQDIGGNPGELNIGAIIGQILQSKMNPDGENDYRRNERGEFDGTPQIIEAKTQNDD